ncbi:hypothetical protein BOX15_Mlig024861g2 [Macrostomum lignano]|uniref:COMM domain-containing protein 5 n=1 Tax=Macrostomum lignano TaxID=282301 RepID=A0A267GBG2_9PLAT|nr:hypothetical protein BOX15_Mlig024861g2 [Macrostomum lignano]
MNRPINPMQIKYHEFVVSDRDIEFLRQNRKVMVDLPVDTELLKAAAKLCAGQPNPALLQRICTGAASPADSEKRAHALGVLLRLFRLTRDLPPKLRQRDRLRDDLRQLKYSEPWIEGLLEMAFDAGFLDAVDKSKKIDARSDPMEEFSWKIDVNICTSKVGKILEPTVFISFRTGDTPHCFEVPLSKFHQLRFTVADLLRDMTQLENHPAVKLDA